MEWKRPQTLRWLRNDNQAKGKEGALRKENEGQGKRNEKMATEVDLPRGEVITRFNIFKKQSLIL
jgi:hypothetical protein